MRIAIALVLGLGLLSGPSLAADFKLTSATLEDGGTLPEAQVANIFGCAGGNISPDLSWSGAPEGTKSFALSVYDPDAPTGSGFWHWVMFNIPANVTHLDEGITAEVGAPAGAVQSKADVGNPAYFGACPPPGDKPHHYIYTVTALGVDKLDLTPDTSGALIGFMVNANALGKASMTLTYGR